MEKPVCLVDGCGAESFARNYCRSHYKKFWRNGTIPKSSRPDSWGSIEKHPLLQK